MTTTTDPAIAAAEQRLEKLRAERERTEVALEAAERDVAPTEEPLELARQVYDAAGRALARAQAPAAWRPDHSGQPVVAVPEDEARRRASEAEAAFRQADRELGAALVAYNAANKRRGDLEMRVRYLSGLVDRAEAELERARRAASPGRDLLARLRAKVARIRPGFPPPGGGT